MEFVQVSSKEKAQICGTFAKPSDGLEPSTPSLPCAPFGNGSQPTARVLAYFHGFRRHRICDRLPPVATTGLHKGSIAWLSELAAPRALSPKGCGGSDACGERGRQCYGHEETAEVGVGVIEGALAGAIFELTSARSSSAAD